MLVNRDPGIQGMRTQLMCAEYGHETLAHRIDLHKCGYTKYYQPLEFNASVVVMRDSSKQNKAAGIAQRNEH